jgi:hypothetical protein
MCLAAWAALLAAPAGLAAAPQPQACQGLDPGNPAGFAGRTGCDVAAGGAGGVAHDAAQATAAGASPQPSQTASPDAASETAFTTWLANGAVWIVQSLRTKVLGPASTPGLNPAQAAAFTHVYGRVVGVALSISVLLILLGIIDATLTRRPGALRRVVVGIAVAGIGLGAVPAATAILVRIVDDLSAYVAGDETQMVAQGLQNLVTVLQQTNPATGAAAFALAALGVMLGGALLWLELMTRENLIYLFLGVVPLACAAVQWPRLEAVLRTVLFAGLALILSKLLIAIALAVGFAVLAQGTGLENLLGGMFVLVVAALLPFAAARALPIAADELSAGYRGRLGGGPVGGVGTTARVVAAVAGGGADAPSATITLAPPMGHTGGRLTPGRSVTSQVAAAGASSAAEQGERPAPPAAETPAAGSGKEPEPPRDAGAPQEPQRS